MRTKGVFKKIGRAAAALLAAAFVCLLGYICACRFSGRAVYFGKYAVLHVVSSSMEPSISADDYILVRKTEVSALTEGDVVAFYSRDPAIAGKLNTHRIREISEEEDGVWFVTKGDANSAADEAKVFGGDVAGRYVKKLPFLTKAGKLFSHKASLVVMVLLPAAFLTGWCARNIVREVKAGKASKLSETSENENKTGA